MYTQRDTQRYYTLPMYTQRDTQERRHHSAQRGSQEPRERGDHSAQRPLRHPGGRVDLCAEASQTPMRRDRDLCAEASQTPMRKETDLCAEASQTPRVDYPLPYTPPVHPSSTHVPRCTCLYTVSAGYAQYRVGVPFCTFNRNLKEGWNLQKDLSELTKRGEKSRK